MRARVEYYQSPPMTALTYSAHRPAAFPEDAARFYHNASSYTGGWPKKVLGKGYPVLRVEDRRDAYFFNSPAEIDLFCAVMGERVLPSVTRLAQMEGSTRRNSHWLSRIPKRSFKERARLVRFIMKNDGPFRALFDAAPTDPAHQTRWLLLTQRT